MPIIFEGSLRVVICPLKLYLSIRSFAIHTLCAFCLGCYVGVHCIGWMLAVWFVTHVKPSVLKCTLENNISVERWALQLQ